jgi:hypothetical protein
MRGKIGGGNLNISSCSDHLLRLKGFLCRAATVVVVQATAVDSGSMSCALSSPTQSGDLKILIEASTASS